MTGQKYLSSSCARKRLHKRNNLILCKTNCYIQIDLHVFVYYFHSFGVRPIHVFGKDILSKCYLCHFLSVGFWIQWCLRHMNSVLLGSYTELIVEGVMPDPFHVVPVRHDSVFYWILQGENSSLVLGFVTNVTVLASHTGHYYLKKWRKLFTVSLVSILFLLQADKIISFFAINEISK